MDPTDLDLSSLPSGKSVAVGRTDAADYVIDHASVSRRHARLERDEEGRVRLIDEGSRFGTFVNKLRIQSRTLSEGDTVRFGAGLPYEFREGRLVPNPELVGLFIRFSGLDLERGGRPVLRDLTCEIDADEFVAVTGPSGCGKSSLLECLVGFHKVGRDTITFDQGRPWSENSEYLLQKTSIVPQRDLLFDELTVAENLRFSLRIRKPELPAREVEALVTEAMEAVDLVACRDVRCGLLSGGQRKRCSVAMELTCRPRLLLLDEPTSGLDPEMEADLFDKLKSLSQRGITVVCVAHTKNLRFFDKIIVLRALGESADGIASVSYCGPPEHLPNGSEAETESGSPHRGSHADSGRREGEVPEVRIVRPKCSNTYLHSQFQTVVERCVVSLLRDRKAMALNLVLPVLTGAMVAVSQRGFGQPANIGFFLVISAFWFGMTSAVRELIKERSLYIRDKLGGLRPSAYFQGKTAYVAALAAAQALLLFLAAAVVLGFLIAIGPVGGVQATLVEKLSLFPTLLATVPVVVSALGGALAGLLVSVVSTSERMASTALPMILLPQILFSRVAVGQGSETKPRAPFGFVAELPDEGLVDGFLYLISLPFITRSSSNVFHLCFDSTGQNTAIAQALEWVYLAVLLAIYYLGCKVVFERCNEGWKDWRQ